MKGYKSLPVGSELILYENLIDNSIFNEEDFKIASLDVTKFKNFIDPNIQDFKIREAPGIQYQLEYIFSEVITKLNLYSINQVKSIYEKQYGREAPLVISSSWIYYQDKAVKNAFWHHHRESQIKTPNNRYGKTKTTKLPNYKTLVIYLQLPEDVKDSGKIWFSPNRNKNAGSHGNKVSKTDVSFTPKVGDVVIFPGTMPHFPELHEGDTTRIVFGSNLYIEKPKTLL